MCNVAFGVIPIIICCWMITFALAMTCSIYLKYQIFLPFTKMKLGAPITIYLFEIAYTPSFIKMKVGAPITFVIEAIEAL